MTIPAGTAQMLAMIPSHTLKERLELYCQLNTKTDNDQALIKLFESELDRRYSHPV